MRLPNYSDLSEEQDNIYLDAPMDGTIFVTGPPGTGKTVIAFYRADVVAEKDEGDVTVAMYNRVLNQYTINAIKDSSIEVTTMFSWFDKWWKRIGRPGDADSAERYDLECPYDEKDDAKEAGARWDRYGRVWWVKGNLYRENPEKFARWNPKGVSGRHMPYVGSDEYEKDWSKVFDLVFKGVEDGRVLLKDLHWGHLIIDEAQDFAEGMFGLFNMLNIMVFSKNSDGLEVPALTVFADENQRLNEKHNSTIEQIRNALEVQKEREYKLTRNYRSTRPIAELAEYFYVGLQTGKPELPDRDGDIPVMVECSSIDKAVDYIYRYAVNHDDEEIGIIVKDNSIRKKFFNKLGHRLRGNKHIYVQTYAYNDKDNQAGDLKFDDEGIISVFNKQSCKGLEFDAVFIPELQQYSLSPDDKDQFMMDMYVMISRARSHVVLMYSNEGTGIPGILNYLPKREESLMEWRNER